MVHIYNRILLSHKKNKLESVLVRWVNLEFVLHREISQKEKNKYSILMHISGIYFQGRNRDAYVENELVDTVEREKVAGVEKVASTFVHSQL